MFWNAQLVPDNDALVERLKKVAVMKPQPEVHIRGDERGALRIGRPRRLRVPARGDPEDQLRHRAAARSGSREEADMAMNVGSSGGGGEPDVMMDINTTPLIDVMLVLLIMLIITIPIQLHSVNLNMPAGNPPPPTKRAGGRDDRHRLRRHDPLERRGAAPIARALEAKLVAGRGASPTSPRCTCGRTSWSSTSRWRRCWPRRSGWASPSSAWSATSSS